jgi:hypothetical protein
MPGRYLDEATLKEFVHSETVMDTALYTAAILAAEERVDDAHARRFAVASTATAKVFRPQSSYEDTLILPDFTTLTSIVENGRTLTVNTDFILYPLNNEDDAGHTVPYDSAVRYYMPWYYDGPKPTVTVTAAWGWASIPFLVVEACKIAAKAILEGRDLRGGLVGWVESGGISEREAKVVKDSIAAYRSHRSWGVA